MATRKGGSRSARRSNSSPSPPGQTASSRLSRSVLRKSGHGQRTPTPQREVAPSNPPTSVDWSTSYQASESSSHNGATSTEEETEDDWDHIPRGRAYSNSTIRHGRMGSLVRRNSGLGSKSSGGNGSASNQPSGSGASGSESAVPSLVQQIHRRRRMSFTRSRSPAIPTLKGTGTTDAQSQATLSAIIARHQATEMSHLLPARFILSCDIPFAGLRYTFSMDGKLAAECFLLILSLAGIMTRVVSLARGQEDVWIYRELSMLISISVLYMVWTNSRIGPPPPSPNDPQQTPIPPLRRGLSVSSGGGTPKDSFGFVWMTVPKNYRESSDDGILTMFILAPMIASAMLYSALQLSDTLSKTEGHMPDLLPRTWRIEPPLVAASGSTSLQSIVASRRSLVNLATSCAIILLVHVLASHYHERRYRWSKVPDAPEGEVASVPRKEAGRISRYMLFSVCVAFGMLVAKAVFTKLGWGFWQNMGYLELLTASLFYQSTMYSSIRLAHRAFTLGEAALTSFGATVLFLELVSLTVAKLWPSRTPFIFTYRLPTPLLIFQIALVPGALLNGFLLAPLLVWSRQLAQMPVRRLRHPGQKAARQRALALGFYGGAALVSGGLIGFWTRWMLGGRDPWMWALRYIAQGRRPWSRPALLSYWALLGVLSVAGWSRQLARSRRYRPRTNDASTTPPTTTSSTAAAAKGLEAPASTDASTNPSPDPSGPSTPIGLTFGSLPTLPNSVGMSQAATDFFDAADRRVPTLSLNARRKFFHALAVAMFLPGVAIDPAFTHLSFSAAFALFTFAEYVRYFALYPFGAAVHVFLSEFLDPKDAGAVVLSHFYLLTGCANSLWLEAPSLLLQFTGILALGVGDALASIVGKRIGRHRWSATTAKSLEGSTAFVLSIVACAWVLRTCGLTEPFSIVRFAIIAVLTAAVEAVSEQNDNLTIPLFMWSVLRVALA